MGIALINQFAQTIAFNVNILHQMTHLTNNIPQMSKLWIEHLSIACLLNYFPIQMLDYI